MHTYEVKTFTIPALAGISQKSLDEHLGLYAGYVKNFNAISAKLAEYATDMQNNALAFSELLRRRSFEFDGMRLHELYFSQFEGGAVPLTAESPLAQALTAEYQSSFIEHFKAVGGMRGPGWAILYYDPIGKHLHTSFVGEQHQGHFATLPIIIALDVWEHAFILDYGAMGKGKYLDAFFANLNWKVVEKRFALCGA